MISAKRILADPRAYLFWQGKFAEQKLVPVNSHNNLASARRVLDVGCGPGTNTMHFTAASYLGLDVNPAYIEYARKRYRRDFLVADVCTYIVASGQNYDFILINSFLHHVDLASTRRILSHLSTLLTTDGHVHIIEPIMPEKLSVARQLARWDRGQYVRPLQEWKDIFLEFFEPVIFEPFTLSRLGIDLWKLVYFKGKANHKAS